jgi:hypothetical protein
VSGQQLRYICRPWCLYCYSLLAAAFALIQALLLLLPTLLPRKVVPPKRVHIAAVPTLLHADPAAVPAANSQKLPARGSFSRQNAQTLQQWLAKVLDEKMPEAVSSSHALLMWSASFCRIQLGPPLATECAEVSARSQSLSFCQLPYSKPKPGQVVCVAVLPGVAGAVLVIESMCLLSRLARHFACVTVKFCRKGVC